MRAGFSLIELVIVVLILGILAAVAAPALFRTDDSAMATAELSNARAFMKAIDLFSAKNCRLPNDAGPGKLPPDLLGILDAKMFTNPSPAGGVYDWDGPPPHSTNELKCVFPAGTSVATTRFYLKMEDLADDGNPTRGWISASGTTIRFRF